MVDLNLLVALEALLEEGSVAKAAERMHLSAPAMSRTLARLREATGDPLFVRAGRGLVPTPHALALHDRVRETVRAAQGLLGPEPPSDPRAFDRVLTIRVNDGVIPSLGAQLLARARAEAPGVVLRFVAEGDEDVAALREGGVDLDLGVQDALGPEIRVRHLFHDPLVALVHEKRRRLAFETSEHVVISRQGKIHTRLDEHVPGKRRVIAVVASGMAGAVLVAKADLVCVVPQRFAEAMTDILPVKVMPLPFDVPPLAIVQAWHPRYDHDPPHRWLRRTLEDLAGSNRSRRREAGIPGSRGKSVKA